MGSRREKEEREAKDNMAADGREREVQSGMEIAGRGAGRGSGQEKLEDECGGLIGTKEKSNIII